jgi:benzodiazapine receptor
MGGMVKSSDRTRAVLVAVLAVAQVLSSPVTTRTFGPEADTGRISDANLSPVTPAGWAFGIWVLIYAGSLVLAVYQLLPSQLPRRVHRRTGWWLVGAFTSSTVFVPLFGTGVIWLSQIAILVLVVCLICVAHRFSRMGPAPNISSG